jgi:hypothetical protein
MIMDKERLIDVRKTNNQLKKLGNVLKKILELQKEYILREQEMKLQKIIP